MPNELWSIWTYFYFMREQFFKKNCLTLTLSYMEEISYCDRQVPQYPLPQPPIPQEVIETL